MMLIMYFSSFTVFQSIKWYNYIHQADLIDVILKFNEYPINCQSSTFYLKKKEWMSLNWVQPGQSHRGPILACLSPHLSTMYHMARTLMFAFNTWLLLWEAESVGGWVKAQFYIFFWWIALCLLEWSSGVSSPYYLADLWTLISCKVNIKSLKMKKSFHRTWVPWAEQLKCAVSTFFVVYWSRFFGRVIFQLSFGTEAY